MSLRPERKEKIVGTSWVRVQRKKEGEKKTKVLQFTAKSN